MTNSKNHPTVIAVGNDGSGAMRVARTTTAFVSAVVTAMVVTPGTARAHFLELLPSADVSMDGSAIALSLVFTHPMARGPVMDLARPKRVGVAVGETTQDLTAALVAAPIEGRGAWRLTHRLVEPGVARFFVEPQPYWEPAEKKWIIHYTKVIVDAFASGEGWATPVGLPVEIEPLTRPTGLWTGNLFRGIVRRDGVPVPFAEVEIEWANDGSLAVPDDAFVTQVVRADANGVFAQTLPRAGWWGFAALVDGPAAKGPNGEAAATELGGLLWVRTTDMTATTGAAAPATK